MGRALIALAAATVAIAALAGHLALRERAEPAAHRIAVWPSACQMPIF